MMNFLREVKFLALVFFGFISALNAEPMAGKDAPADFRWQPATDKQSSFSILALDGKDRTFYVDMGAFFAPIKASGGRDLYTKYAGKIGEELKFYNRKEDGKIVYFTEAFSAKTDKLKDFIIALYPKADGTLAANCIDISLERMPLASFSVVNISPFYLGLAADKTFAKLEPFKSFSKKFDNSKIEILTCTLKMYDLKKPSNPRHLMTKTYSFWTSKRTIVLFFDMPEGYTEDGSKPSNVILYDKGPR